MARKKEEGKSKKKAKRKIKVREISSCYFLYLFLLFPMNYKHRVISLIEKIF
jgi:hypothetical protein